MVEDKYGQPCAPLEEPYYYSFDEKKEEPYHELPLGDHSYSWLTLKELKKIIKYFEKKEYEIHGMISKKQAKDLEKGIKPTSWCSWTTANGYVSTSWKVPATDCLSPLVEVIKELEKLKKENKVTEDEVRYIFGFDS